MSVEQHLMRLQQIGPHQKGAAVRQLDMGNLQLDAFTAHIGPVFAPLELERLAWCEHQWYESSPIRRMIRALAFFGGVPRRVIIDNPKSCPLRRHWFKPNGRR